MEVDGVIFIIIYSICLLLNIALQQIFLSNMLSRYSPFSRMAEQVLNSDFNKLDI